jgi:hypothetical protein
MTEDVTSAIAAADSQGGKNFRASYYDSLVFRGEEEKNIGCLESLLTAEIIDIEGLKQFCRTHTLPPYHRLQVWNIILGVAPPYNDEATRDHVKTQRAQQFSDLRRAVLLCLASSPLHPPSPHCSKGNDREIAQVDRQKCLTPEQLVMMYLLQHGQLPTSAGVHGVSVQHQDSVCLARAFLDLCEEEREAYWLYARFSRMLDKIDRNLLKTCCFQYIEKEEPSLCSHIKSLADGIPFSLWFNQCFASTLPEYCLEGVWDRLIGGCVMILVFLAVAILLSFKRRLLGARTSAAIAEVLVQIPEENCVLIVMKAVELWEANGCPLSPTLHTNHNND